MKEERLEEALEKTRTPRDRAYHGMINQRLLAISWWNRE